MVRHFRVSRTLASRLEELGVRVSGVLHRAGLKPDLFQQKRILVSTEELFALWRAIGESGNDPSIGLKLGTETRIERFPPMGIAALSTENFGAAVAHMAKYKRLSAPEEILFEHDLDEWNLWFRWSLAVEVEPPVLIEQCFAWMLSIARQGTGKEISPLRIEFVQLLEHRRILERHFGCPIVCGAARNAMIFRSEDAERPFITRNADLLEMLAPQFDLDLKAQTEAEDGFIGLVRGAIQRRLTGHRPVVDDVAKDLHLSSRTLQRRLQESGSSYQKVLDEARHRMARYYLRNSVLELTETAYLLGYEDADSFARAFRGWEGMPPRHWRDAQRPEIIQ